MVCIYCSGKTQVTNSRPQKRTNTVWRRRRCTACGAVITTEELPRYESTAVIQRPGGTLQPFSDDRLLISLYKSLAHRKTAIEDARALCGTIITILQKNSLVRAPIELPALKKHVYLCLKRFDTLAAEHYAAYHIVEK